MTLLSHPLAVAALLFFVCWLVIFGLRLYYMYFWMRAAVRQEPFHHAAKLRRVNKAYGVLAVTIVVLVTAALVLDRMGILKIVGP